MKEIIISINYLKLLMKNIDFKYFIEFQLTSHINYYFALTIYRTMENNLRKYFNILPQILF